jgi:hypothetical protein
MCPLSVRTPGFGITPDGVRTGNKWACFLNFRGRVQYIRRARDCRTYQQRYGRAYRNREASPAAIAGDCFHVIEREIWSGEACG